MDEAQTNAKLWTGSPATRKEAHLSAVTSTRQAAEKNDPESSKLVQASLRVRPGRLSDSRLNPRGIDRRLVQVHGCCRSSACCSPGDPRGAGRESGTSS